MTLCILRCTILTILSHLLLVAPAFTTQLPSSFDAQLALPAPSQEVTIKAREQSRHGDVYSLEGDIEIDFQDFILRAEHATYNESTGDIEASGGVVFEIGRHEAHLTAARAVYNVKRETGDFYEVSGTFGAVVRGQSVVLTTSNPFVVAAREVRKVGRNQYVVSHGSITSCAEQGLRWSFESEKIDVVAGDDAKLYHSSFRLLKFPLFYVPYTKLPASGNSRNSGFLLPTVGNSSNKGFIFGESVYWAINRSNDAALGAEYFSERGWSQTVHLRSKPSENSSIELRYFGVQDRGAPGTHQDQGGDEARLVADTTRDHWRASASIDYLSSFLFRQAFSGTYTQAVNSEVRSVAYFSHNQAGLSLNLDAERYQNFFQDPVTKSFSQQVRILHMPVAEFNALEHPLGSAPLRWALDASAGGLQRSEPHFVTANLVGRLDIRPRVALPLQLHGWDLRPEVAVQDTLYTQRVTPSPTNPLGIPSGNELNRRAVEATIELRPPAMEKVFERPVFGRRIKHVIEPILLYNYVSGAGNPQNVIRFDQIDILSNTSEFEYDLIQRVYGRRDSGRRAGPRRPPPACEDSNPTAFGEDKMPPAYIPGVSAPRPRCEPESDTARELLSWEVKQKYYVDQSFGGALVAGRRNVLATTVDLTGIAFLDGPRTWSPVVSTLRVQTSANTDVQWQLDYDSVRGRINSSATFLEYRLGEYFAGVSHAFFHEPPNSVTPTFSNAPLVFDQIRYLVGYGHPNKRGLAGGFSMGYDKNLEFLQYAAGQSSYNWQCCGVSFEYRHLNVPGVNVENQYRFAFTLANIGTFGNLRRQERLY